MDNEKPIPLLQLANDLGFHRNSIKACVISRGFRPFRVRESTNSALYLTHNEAEQFTERIILERENVYREYDHMEPIQLGISGVYAIEVPSYDSCIRIKIGWSDDIDSRLNTYRTVIPDLQIQSIWPTTESWFEKMALRWARNNGKQISQEIFEFSDIESAINALSRIFNELGIRTLTEL